VATCNLCPPYALLYLGAPAPNPTLQLRYTSALMSRLQSVNLGLLMTIGSRRAKNTRAAGCRGLAVEGHGDGAGAPRVGGGQLGRL
jgi:hypothetical protein